MCFVRKQSNLALLSVKQPRVDWGMEGFVLWLKLDFFFICYQDIQCGVFGLEVHIVGIRGLDTQCLFHGKEKSACFLGIKV